MKTLGRFSKKKFQGLSPVNQIKALNKLASALEEAWGHTDTVTDLTGRLLECVAWMPEPVPENVLRLSRDLAAASTSRAGELAIARFQSSLGINFKDSQLKPKNQDGPRFADLASLERAGGVILILADLRSAFNVGSIFRSAECLGLGEIWLCGVTATPDEPALLKTARGTASRVAWRHFETSEEAAREAKSRGFRLYALETAPQAGSAFGADYQLPLALVLGNESLGISEEVLRLCDEVVCLPVQGWKNSLNVAVACAVCAYQIVFGSPQTEMG